MFERSRREGSACELTSFKFMRLSIREQGLPVAQHKGIDMQSILIHQIVFDQSVDQHTAAIQSGYFCLVAPSTRELPRPHCR